MSLVAPQKGGFSLSRLSFGVVLLLVKAYSSFHSLFWAVPPFARDNVTEYFDLQIYYKSTLCRLYYKVRQALLQKGATLMYYKVEQVLLQIGAAFSSYKLGQLVLQSKAGIRKWGRHYEAKQLLLKRAGGITNWGYYYKVWQYIFAYIRNFIPLT